MQNGIAALDDNLTVSYKTLNTLLAYYLAIVLFGVYPKELKTYVHTEFHTWMFIAALFVIAKT